MEPHRKKQFLIAGFAAIAALAVISASSGRRFYGVLYPAPPPAAKKPLLDLIWVKAFPGEHDFYDVAARVRNNSVDKGVRRFRYRIELVAAGGEVLGERVGGSYLRRGEVKYIVENSVTSVSPPTRVRLFVSDIVAVDDAESETPPFILQQKNFTEGALNGVVLNRSAVGFQELNVAAVLFDRESHPLRARATTLTRLLPNEERGFEMRWQNPGSVGAEEVEISTNIFDPDNYIPEERKGLEQ